jgi:hypothetical protein
MKKVKSIPQELGFIVVSMRTLESICCNPYDDGKQPNAQFHFKHIFHTRERISPCDLLRHLINENSKKLSGFRYCQQVRLAQEIREVRMFLV